MLNRESVAGVACSFLVTYYRGFVREQGAAAALADLYGENAYLTYAEYNEETPAVAHGRHEILQQLVKMDAQLGRRKVVVSFADYSPLPNGGVQVECQGILHLCGQRRAFFQVFVLAPTEFRANTYHIVTDYFRVMMIEVEQIPEDGIVMTPADVAKHLLEEHERCKRRAELLEQQRAEAEALRLQQQQEAEAEAARRKLQQQQQQQQEGRRERSERRNGGRHSTSNDDNANHKPANYENGSNTRFVRGERHNEQNGERRRERREQRPDGKRGENNQVNNVKPQEENGNVSSSVSPNLAASKPTRAPRQREPRSNANNNNNTTTNTTTTKQDGNSSNNNNVNRPLPRSLAAQEARAGRKDENNNSNTNTNKNKNIVNKKEAAGASTAAAAAAAAPSSSSAAAAPAPAKTTKPNATKAAETTPNKNAVNSRTPAKRSGSTDHVRVLRVPTDVKLSDIKETVKTILGEDPLDAYWFGRSSGDCVLQLKSTSAVQKLTSHTMTVMDVTLKVTSFYP
ncbi:uncharacterized protein TM35_000121550 [Trypanosoma theileri]|uniref:NTF2 domain-containing protein n=1 Tax=Trypanosoma theileri TaxID=67003 RepID=A0A1X0NZ06_9TRYP|nr:uncharacterized protein TM35_000121550 [Trypanosoma theileri]ORC89380.1 hypothetical protein TM35_000121550 [Trypanosoma theileri]